LPNASVTRQAGAGGERVDADRQRSHPSPARESRGRDHDAEHGRHCEQDSQRGADGLGRLRSGGVGSQQQLARGRSQVQLAALTGMLGAGVQLWKTHAGGTTWSGTTRSCCWRCSRPGRPGNGRAPGTDAVRPVVEGRRGRRAVAARCPASRPPDVKAAVARAQNEGAKVIVPPPTLPEGDEMALLLRPNLMSFALHKPARKG
jgi:hypothetical protein